jgi:hypothetical protein
MEERKKKRREKLKSGQAPPHSPDDAMDERATSWLASNEDELIKFTAKVNKIYQEKLKEDAPFMTFVFCGMQSAGKSTIMERFMMAVLNIVHEGTGTRCPLDTTCIHDESCVEPKCDLWGEELQGGGREGITVEMVFEKITGHNKMLEGIDAFSTKPLHLIFRANNVQNMRFVDTPGIITTQGTGNDNREDIKTILRSEMQKQNSKLCLLLEPKEFQTNDIVNFCDETLGGRANWTDNAICLMNKFDQKMEDTRTANRANGFFKTFHENGCFPYLIMTPTLPNENLPIHELFLARQKLLVSADEKEDDRFQSWRRGQETYRHQNEEQNETLDAKMLQRIGFQAAKTDMRKIMLADTAKRLPEVIKKLREEKNKREKEQRELKEKQKFTDPAQLRVVATELVFHLKDRVMSYLDGDLQTAKKFPDRLQSLDEEMDEEEESEWASKDLNHHTEKENKWRENIAALEEYPDFVQAEDKFIGGKQCQRAISFFNWVMIDSLPDPTQLKEVAKNGCGYLGDGLRRENYERLIVQITKSCMNEITDPGTNYVVKHIGSILRRLFALAMDDLKSGESMSATFKLMPHSVEKYLKHEFDKMLWSLMTDAAEKTHCALAPMYSTINPNLPTFDADMVEKEGDEEKGLVASSLRTLASLVSGTGEAKKQLKEESQARATTKKGFLPDKRAAMITSDETDAILKQAFRYIVALMDVSLLVLQFQLDHYLIQSFKDMLQSSFIKTVMNADWTSLCKPDKGLEARLLQLEDQIASLSESLQEVGHINMRL